MNEMNDLVGRTLLNCYRVDSLIGRGGMAEVYKGWDSRRATHVALKFLREDLAQDVVFLRKFRREAAVLKSLDHPHIVRFYGFEEEGLLAFLVLQYIQGGSLRAVIRTSQGEPMSSDKILQYLEPLCSALRYAHERGVFHCDLKPANILVSDQGHLFVSDFGVAKLAESATMTTTTPGTPAYMSPEQCKGGRLDRTTDIYSLGITLYEMLTGGERPFTGDKAPMEGSTAEGIRWEHINEEPPSPCLYEAAIPPAVEAVVLRALAKKPGVRYQSVMDLLAAWSQALGEKVTVAHVEALPEAESYQRTAPDQMTVEESGTIRRRLSPTLAVALVAIVGLVVLMAVFGTPLVFGGPPHGTIFQEVPAAPTVVPTTTLYGQYTDPQGSWTIRYAISSWQLDEENHYLLHRTLPCALVLWGFPMSLEEGDYVMTEKMVAVPVGEYVFHRSTLAAGTPQAPRYVAYSHEGGVHCVLCLDEDISDESAELTLCQQEAEVVLASLTLTADSGG